MKRRRETSKWKKNGEVKKQKTYTDQFGREVSYKEYLETIKSDKKSNEAKERQNISETKVDMSNMDINEVLGFASFGTSKNKKIDENHKSAAKGAKAKVIKRTYRQYMNRPGGFNRPLAEVKDSKGVVKKREENK